MEGASIGLPLTRAISWMTRKPTVRLPGNLPYVIEANISMNPLGIYKHATIGLSARVYLGHLANNNGQITLYSCRKTYMKRATIIFMSHYRYWSSHTHKWVMKDTLLLWSVQEIKWSNVNRATIHFELKKQKTYTLRAHQTDSGPLRLISL